MHVRSLAALAPPMAFLAVGCSDPVVADAPASLPCDVDYVLQRACRKCHSDPPSFGAPIPLVTLADLHAAAPGDPSQKVYERVKARIHDDAASMPPPPNPRLAAAELAVVDAWIDAGAPAGDHACAANDAPDGGGLAPQCDPDRRLAPPAPITVPEDADSFLCYGVDVAPAGKRHVIGMLPRVDDAALLHHMTLYLADGPVDPTPKPCAQVGEPGWRVMSAWTPGADALYLPPEAGFPEDGGTHYVVQVHYANPGGLAGREDTSGYDLCTTDALRPHDADVLVFGAQSFVVPAHGALDVACDYGVPPALDQRRAIFALPHMHVLGTSIATTLQPSGGGPNVDLGARAPWNFENQYWSPIDAVLHGGDVVTTRCAWSNPTSTDAHFGEGAHDEMCWSFTLYYPKVEASGWSWSLPSQSAICHLP